MNRRNRIECREWIKAAAGISGGMILAVVLLAVWLAANNFFCIPKAEADARRAYNEAMERAAVCPFDEFAGLDPEAWKN